ncbi:MAG: amidohydrolase family protein [Deltaproteobacteria bacterium]|nr:amidohydrolase family protein [Deltaproteobacteria bacterium]
MMLETLTFFAIVGALIRPVDGPPIPQGTIVVRDGRIVSVAAGRAPPAGAEVIDGAGMVVTPGFVAVESALGLVEIDLEDSTRDAAPEGDASDPVRAAFSAADGYNPLATAIPVARTGGVTSALSTPMGGLVSGTSAWVDLAGERPADAIARAVAALHVRLDDGGIGASGGARSSTLTRLRETLDDARLYGRSRGAYDRRALREMRVSRLDLERLQEALAGRIPVVVRVSRASDILRVLELAREYRFRLVLAGAEEAWRVADRIAADDVPVILQPLTNLPTSFATLGSRYDNAALLVRAGVRVVFEASGAADLRNLRQEAGNAVAWGVDPEVALRALTLEPARVFGMDREYGALTPNRVANLVMWSGDPFETSTRAVRVWIRGRNATLRTRQTALFERYRDLRRVRRGAPRPSVPVRSSGL